MKVKFVPQNVEFEIKPGESVMHLAEDNGLYVKSVCRGVPSCAECRVKIVEGETNVFAPVAAELALIGSGYFIDRRRLACQLQCIGDVTIDMSEQIAKQQGLLGGRKAKAAKAIGDRVEDETVIRDSSAAGIRSSGRSGGRDRDDDDDLDESDEAAKPQKGDLGNDRKNEQRNAPRPQPPKSNVVIGGNARPQVGTGTVVPDSGPSPVAPAAGSPIVIGGPPSAGPAGGGIQPRPQGAPPEGGRPGGGEGRGQGGGDGRSRRGGRRR